MTWIKCSDGLPDREGDILVKINGKVFLAEVIDDVSQYYLKENGVYFQTCVVSQLALDIDKNYCCNDVKIERWIIPAHFREPDEWMYVP